MADPSNSPEPRDSHAPRNTPEPSYSPAPQPEPGPQPDPLAQPKQSSPPDTAPPKSKPQISNPQPQADLISTQGAQSKQEPLVQPPGSKPLAEPPITTEPQPLGERLKGWLDALLVADVFLVIGAALWFGLAVLLHSRGVEAPLQLFERLWQPLFLPAISLLMAAAIVSGLLGWWRRRGQR